MEKVLIIEPKPSGHCAFYLSLIVQAFPESEITLLAPREDTGIRDHFKRRDLEFESYKFVEPLSCEAASVVRQAAEIVRAGGFQKVFFSYLDTYLQELLLRKDGFPCPVSGIWFHPHDLDGKYRWLPPLDKRLGRRGRVHRTLRKVHSNLVFEHLFFLDPASVEKLHSLNPRIAASILPDPWEKRPTLDMSQARERFGLPADRKIFLHIGGSEKRKGLVDVIAAFDEICRQQNGSPPLLLRVGENERLNNEDRQRLISLEKEGFARLVEGYVPEEYFTEYFSAADWILIPYRSFRYSSGILSNAIGAGKPVIAANYGLIGATVNKRSLGLLFRHKSTEDLKRKIMDSLDDPQSEFTTISSKDISPNHFVKILRDAMS